MSKFKVFVTCVISLCIMLLLVLFFNYVSDKQAKDKASTNDVTDSFNFDEIDSSLGEEININQVNLNKYIIKKNSIWYMSEGKINKINSNQGITTIIFNTSSGDLTALVDSTKFDYKVGDYIYFVGSININEGVFTISKISNEPIDYNSCIVLSIDDLCNNINLVVNNYFIVDGYMVTEGTIYKIYDSKDDYLSNKEAGYFILSWDGEFNYTGNANVSVKCNIGNSYSLKKCILLD